MYSLDNLNLKVNNTEVMTEPLTVQLILPSFTLEERNELRDVLVNGVAPEQLDIVSATTTNINIRNQEVVQRLRDWFIMICCENDESEMEDSIIKERVLNKNVK